jgi:hypothetical protein
MTKREEIVELSGQIINGIMSSDSSILSKICDRTSSDISAKRAVEMAFVMLEEIDKKMNNEK